MEANTNANVNTGMDFSVSPDSLYQAWTDPEQLKQWWKPMGSQLTDVVNELNKGGKIEYKFQADERENLIITGEYLEVVPNEKLVYTWNWQMNDEALDDSEYKLTVIFKSAENGSRLEIAQENNKDQEPLIPHKHGWEEALDHLAQHLDSQNDHSESHGAASSPSDHEGKPDYGSQNPATV